MKVLARKETRESVLESQNKAGTKVGFFTHTTIARPTHQRMEIRFRIVNKRSCSYAKKNKFSTNFACDYSTGNPNQNQ